MAGLLVNAPALLSVITGMLFLVAGHLLQQAGYTIAPVADLCAAGFTLVGLVITFRHLHVARALALLVVIAIVVGLSALFWLAIARTFFGN